MYIIAHDKFGQLIKQPVTHVVVYDDNDIPLAVSVQVMDRMIMTAHVKDKDFRDVLKSLGIDKTFVVDNFDARSVAVQ